MSKLKIKKIGINMIVPNMVLAEDAVSKNGVTILAKNTKLTSSMSSTLLANGINKVCVFFKDNEDEENDNKIKRVSSHINNIKNDEDADNKNADKIYKEDNTIPNKKEIHKKFESSYNERIQIIKNQFISIGDGFGTEIEGAYYGITDIVKSVDCKGSIFKYLNLLQKKDDRVYEHCLNVALIANLFALWLGYSDEEVKNITIAGLLHDVGKINIEDSIIKKDGKLTEKEYSDIKKHVDIGYEIIKDFSLPDEVKLSVLMHHERIDGSGYPFGKKDNEICQTAKIIAICDIYIAMTSDNYYRKKYCPFEVIESLEKDYEGLLDGRLLLAFLQNIAYTYIGSNVRLSNGMVAKVVFINQNRFSRPMVRVGNEFIDLFEENICIDEVL